MTRYAREVATIGNTSARVAELRRLASTEHAIERVLVPAFEDPYPPLRHTAALETAARMTPELSRELGRITRGETSRFEVDSKKPGVRAAAALALDVDGISREAFDALAHATLHDIQATVRYHSLMALHRNRSIDPGAELAVVREVLEEETDPATIVVACQIAAFEQYDELSASVDRARARLSGNDEFQAVLSLAELSRLGVQIPLDAKAAVTGQLIERLDDEETLAAAAQALADLGISAAERPLEKIVKGWFVHPILKVDAAAALIRLGHQAGMRHFEGVLSGRRKDARGYALRLAGNLGLAAFRKTVEAEARSDSYHADTATIALHAYGDARATETLRELSRNHPQLEVREIATALLNGEEVQ